MIPESLIERILAEYSLPILGIHGIPHWARVLENGRQLGRHTHVRPNVVELFALLHDSRRSNESSDPDHGLRAADFAKSLRRDALHLSDSDFSLLYEACAYHTRGLVGADPTVQVCWDADRLDLGRTGSRPCPERLCTAGARDTHILLEADGRSRSRCIPRLAVQEWSLHAVLSRMRNSDGEPRVLYHGSGIPHIDLLQPHLLTVPSPDVMRPAVYATRYPAFAAGHVFKLQKIMGFLSGNPQCLLYVLESDQQSLNTMACIYLVAPHGFEPLAMQFEGTPVNYMSPAPVATAGEIRYPDVTSAFEELGGLVNVVSRWPEGWPCPGSATARPNQI